MKKILITALMFISMTACGNTQNSNNKQSNKVQTVNKMKPVKLTTADFLNKVANYETNPNEWKYLGDRKSVV